MREGDCVCIYEWFLANVRNIKFYSVSRKNDMLLSLSLNFWYEGKLKKENSSKNHILREKMRNATV